MSKKLTQFRRFMRATVELTTSEIARHQSSKARGKKSSTICTQPMNPQKIGRIAACLHRTKRL